MKKDQKNSRKNENKLIGNCTQKKINLHESKAPQIESMFLFVSEI